MKAEAQTFSGIVGTSDGTTKKLKIPFFQRAYVWDAKNWESLLSDLLDENNDHFLGSVILKPGQESFTVREWSVIDGQQRLTTLSVLLKVCGDKLLSDPELNDKSRNVIGDKITNALFVVTEDAENIVKLSHSRVDRGAYEQVLGVENASPVISKSIIECKKYFEEHLDVAGARKIYDLLLKYPRKILVGILLEGNDHEQAIFDTINTAGVRLTMADTVKNYIFQKYLDMSKDEDAVWKDYIKYWENVFWSDEDCRNYWSAKRSQGRIESTTLEVFLQCVAIVTGIFDPTDSEMKLANLADCFKKRIDDIHDIRGFKEYLSHIAELANEYREFFVEFKDDELIPWKDSAKRALHIFRTCDTSTFDPLILKILVDSKACGEEGLEKLNGALDELASYVLRHIVARASAKNFYKECAVVIKGSKTVRDYIEEKKENGEIDDSHVIEGLRCIKNKIAKEILLWLEAKKRDEIGADYNGIVSNHRYDLEHIMPQEWDVYWRVGSPAVVNPEDGSLVSDKKMAEEFRNKAIFEIGNMVLLNAGANRGIKNREMQVKLEGDGARIKGIKHTGKSESVYTRDVLEKIEADGYLWDEKKIRDRTKILSDVFLSIW